MKSTAIGPQDLREILAYAAAKIAQEEGRLNALDSAIGDGDHGITMRIGFEAVRKRVNELDSGAGLHTVLNEAGMAFMGATGGAIGVILARMLMASGAALRDREELGPSELKILLNSMESAVAQTGKAKPGDKTILDAVHAANESLAMLSNSDQNLVKMLSRAAASAEEAAQDTASMVCRVGRASRLGERALGHADPGATSFALILKAILEWMQGHPWADTRSTPPDEKEDD